MEYLIAFTIAIGLNIVMFVPAFIFKTDKLTDLSYAISFVVVASLLYMWSSKEAGHLLLLAVITLWAVRLGGYLFIRIRRMDRDKRFDGMRESFTRFLRFWLLQGVTVSIVLLAAISYFNVMYVDLTVLSYIGLMVFMCGFVIEAIADIQKYSFINDKSNQGMWIDEGLWHYSRHPNYFGEILVWLGIYIFTLPQLLGASVLVGLISPLYIAFLIIFVSGVPLLEKSADARWGGRPDYEKYKASTSVLIPYFKKRV